MVSWSFDPDEFAHVWRETDLDVYPYPVRILETPATQDDARLLRRELDLRYPRGRDADLTVALRILAQPHTRIVVIGSTTTPGGEIRMLACLMVQRAVLVVQEPGKTTEFGGHVRVAMGHAANIGRRLATRLPPVEAGGEPWRTTPTDSLRQAKPYTLTGELDRDTVVGQVHALLERPRLGEGHIRIEPRLDRPHPPAPTDYSWIDVAGDGRYLIKPGERLHIGPGSTDLVAQQIQRLVPRGW